MADLKAQVREWLYGSVPLEVKTEGFATEQEAIWHASGTVDEIKRLIGEIAAEEGGELADRAEAILRAAGEQSRPQ